MPDLEGALLKSDKIALVITAETDDTLRVGYINWDNPVIIRKGESLEIKHVRGQVNVFRRANTRKRR